MVLSARAIAVLVIGVGWSGEAAAQRLTTRDALERLEELFELRQEEGTLRTEDVVPTIVVSLEVRYEESRAWYPAQALTVLGNAFGAASLRVCEACMQPRTYVQEGRVEHSAGPVALGEVRRLDDGTRGTAEPARTGIWLDETRTGVAVKIVELSTGRVLYAENVDPTLRESAYTEDMLRLSAELERRARGDSITQAFVDMSLYPGQHFSLDWTDQWGETNANFTGFTLSFFDPVVGVGLAYYRVFEVFNLGGFRLSPQIGVKGIMSLPTALVENLSPEDVGDLLDPLLTGVFVLRIPFGGSNYGLVATASTNLRFGIGISLLNFSLIPVVP